MQIAETVQRRPLILVSLLLAAFVINLDIDDRQRGPPDAGSRAARVELAAAVGRRRLQPGVRRAAAGRRQPQRPPRPQGIPARRPGRVRSRQYRRRRSPTPPSQLIVARCFMGLGAAMIFPTTLSLISNVFTERAERAKAIGLWGATAGVAIALGPIVGGWLLEQFSWASIFFAMAPVAAVGAALVALERADLARSGRAPDRLARDWCSRARRSALLTYTLIEAPNYGWSAAAPSRASRSQRCSSPPSSSASDRRRADARPSACSATFASPPPAAPSPSPSSRSSGFSLLITQYFQFFKGYGPLSTGVRLLPVALAVGGRCRCSAPSSPCASAPSRSSPPACSALAGFFAWVSTADRAPATSRSPARWCSAAAAWARQRTRDRSDHGGRTEGQGRHRLRCQRRHPPARKHPRRRRARQRLRLSLQQPTDRQASRASWPRGWRAPPTTPPAARSSSPTARASTATPHSEPPSTPQRPTRSSTASAPPASSPQASAQWPRSPPWCCSQPIPQPG